MIIASNLASFCSLVIIRDSCSLAAHKTSSRGAGLSGAVMICITTRGFFHTKLILIKISSLNWKHPGEGDEGSATLCKAFNEFICPFGMIY